MPTNTPHGLSPVPCTCGATPDVDAQPYGFYSVACDRCADGAPDAAPQPSGVGRSEADAVNAWNAQIAELQAESADAEAEAVALDHCATHMDALEDSTLKTLCTEIRAAATAQTVAQAREAIVSAQHALETMQEDLRDRLETLASVDGCGTAGSPCATADAQPAGAR